MISKTELYTLYTKANSLSVQQNRDMLLRQAISSHVYKIVTSNFPDILNTITYNYYRSNITLQPYDSTIEVESLFMDEFSKLSNLIHSFLYEAITEHNSRLYSGNYILNINSGFLNSTTYTISYEELNIGETND